MSSRVEVIDACFQNNPQTRFDDVMDICEVMHYHKRFGRKSLTDNKQLFAIFSVYFVL